ncbi:glycerophosphodiester phosphodiesterase family protein [Vibrio maerlii]|uniref:glycerophosphodiester phosphodiesterase family protein n=1 Tax=Vibrio maerlii TaxID=2231648 RepID=UPI0013E0D347|nr:glycerophosphodiester phosphodiesterase family protein [Vibrio maerlii]
MLRQQRLNKLVKQSDHKPLCIAHRGASGHRLENTLEAFEYAADLGAEMWEIDVRLTADGVCVISHDDNLMHTAGVDVTISEVSFEVLSSYRLFNNQSVPTFEQVLDLAMQTGTGLYVELKGEGAGAEVLKTLERTPYDEVAIGSFVAEWVAEMDEVNCPYPLSVLVRVGDCPFEQAKKAKADMIHLCWERASDTPHELLTDELLQTAKEQQLPIVIWHEERPSEIEKLLHMPVIGICSDLPELITGYHPHPSNPIQMVLHRGANDVAPENTKIAAEIGYRAGASVIELDLNTSSDGELMVIHDPTADRTTNLIGEVSDISREQFGTCDAGTWFHPSFSKQSVSTFGDFLELAKENDGELYVELKQANVGQVIETGLQHNALSRCFFWSFNNDYIRELKTDYPDAGLMLRRQDFDSFEALLDFAHPVIIEYDYLIDDLREFSQCRDHGIKSMLRYPGTDQGVWVELIGKQPDMVNIDFPFAFAKAYEAWKQKESFFE